MTFGQLILSSFLSLVGMPGAGHWKLGWRMRSYCFIAPTFLLFGVILSAVFKAVSAQMDNIAKLQKLGTAKMAAQLSQNLTATQTDDVDMKLITFLLVACYVASIADLIWLYQSQAELPKK